MKYISNILKRSAATMLVIAAVLSWSIDVFAHDDSHYASTSALAEGKWMKIRATDNGMNLIPTQQLRNYGFTDLSKVHVYGAGGRMTPDLLTTDVADDLPMLPSVLTDKGLVFFATDQVSWTYDGSNHRHSQHAYCNGSYYFVSDREAEPVGVQTVDEATAMSPEVITTFRERLLHEKDLTAPSNTGRTLLGEDFRTQTSRTFAFTLDGKADDSVNINVCFGAKVSGSSTFKVAANGTPLNGAGTSIAAVTSKEMFLRQAFSDKDATVSGSDLNVKIDFSYSGVPSVAALDYIEVCYNRRLEIPSSGSMHFYLNPSAPSKVEVSNAAAASQVWDVTIPHQPKLVSATLDNGKMSFIAPSGYREYVAFTPANVSRTISYVGSVANQDLHGMKSPDMVIISPSEYMTAAERIAQLHRDKDGLTVYCVTPDQVYNEFSSGSPDVGAFRKMLKMWVDRASSEGSEPTRFCLIMGRPDYNFKTAARSYQTVPIWLSPDGFSQATSYSTDFYIGMTDDPAESFNIGSEKIRVAVGRLPVKSALEAQQMADKLVKYVTKPDFGSWRNQTMIIADDQDGGVHLDQAEKMYRGLVKTDVGPNYIYEKLYLDSYPLEFSSVGPAYVKAKERMLKLMNDGCAHITYIGHASPRGWGHEHLFKWLDLTNMTNSRLPFIYAATCEFGRWDDDAVSGAEEMLLNPTAGVIGMITPSRTVYITKNGYLSEQLGKVLYNRRNGKAGYTIGETFVQALNGISSSDDNKLRYCIISDPALNIPVPERTVRVTSINGVDITDEAADAPIIPALGKISLKGEILLADGTVDKDFNGSVTANLFDAEMPVTTNGNNDDKAVRTYNDRKTRLQTARGSVTDGEFSFNILMPTEIENNFSPALLNLYANDDRGVEANGATDRLYVYGFNEDEFEDIEGPEIVRFTLNGDNFVSGQKTHTTPLVLATLTDDSGINLSESGLGHKLTLVLDERTIYDDLINYYTPDAADERRGFLSFSLPEVEPGAHKLKLVAWDNANNSSSAELDFTAIMYKQPTIYDVTAYGAPGSASVRFTLSHDRASEAVTCSVDVYDLGGRKVWSGKTTEASALATADIEWDLTDSTGSRVPGGIYVYRAIVTTSDGVSTSQSRRLAIH